MLTVEDMHTETSSEASYRMKWKFMFV